MYHMTDNKGSIAMCGIQVTHSLIKDCSLLLCYISELIFWSSRFIFNLFGVKDANLHVTIV